MIESPNQNEITLRLDQGLQALIAAEPTQADFSISRGADMRQLGIVGELADNLARFSYHGLVWRNRVVAIPTGLQFGEFVDPPTQSILLSVQIDASHAISP